MSRSEDLREIEYQIDDSGVNEITFTDMDHQSKVELKFDSFVIDIYAMNDKFDIHFTRNNDVIERKDGLNTISGVVEYVNPRIDKFYSM